MQTNSLLKLSEKLKQFDQSSKNKSKCTPKFTLKLLFDQMKWGEPSYRPKYCFQQYDINKMEIFQFEIISKTAQFNIKGTFCFFIYRFKDRTGQ